MQAVVPQNTHLPLLEGRAQQMLSKGNMLQNEDNDHQIIRSICQKLRQKDYTPAEQSLCSTP